jgi:hypothetical protein
VAGILLRGRPDAQPVRAAVGADPDQVQGLYAFAGLGCQVMLEQHERGPDVRSMMARWLKITTDLLPTRRIAQLHGEAKHHSGGGQPLTEDEHAAAVAALRELAVLCGPGAAAAVVTGDVGLRGYRDLRGWLWGCPALTDRADNSVRLHS